MAGAYGKKIQGSNAHLSNLTSARFVKIDGSATPTTVVATTSGCRLIRAVLNTNGNTVGIRTGSRGIGIIASDAPEGTFDYGVYCENGIQVDTGGAVDVTIVYAI